METIPCRENVGRKVIVIAGPDCFVLCIIINSVKIDYNSIEDDNHMKIFSNMKFRGPGCVIVIPVISMSN